MAGFSVTYWLSSQLRKPLSRLGRYTTNVTTRIAPSHRSQWPRGAIRLDFGRSWCCLPRRLCTSPSAARLCCGTVKDHSRLQVDATHGDNFSAVPARESKTRELCGPLRGVGRDHLWRRGLLDRLQCRAQRRQRSPERRPYRELPCHLLAMDLDRRGARRDPGPGLPHLLPIRPGT